MFLGVNKLKHLMKIAFIVSVVFAGIYVSCAYPLAACQIERISREIFHSSSLGFEDIVRGAKDVNARDRNGDTPLIRSVKSGNHMLARTLLDNGAGVNERGRTTETPLIIAARRGDLESTGILLLNGADVNARDKNNETALIAAVMARQPYVVEMLLDAGADQNLRDKSGRTASTIAAMAGLSDILDILARPDRNHLSSMPPEDLNMLGWDYIN